jgi:nitroimidazol reductase NimA-like FMN-containing flavoprotein (pyridoxamine 5'-phosphate oxidase superfamily)
MREIRRKEKAIQDEHEMHSILRETKYVTIAMCSDNEPYLVTLSHGYDSQNNCIYFHCAQEGKKIDILRENGIVWGQALVDHGYANGNCDHLYVSVHFKGHVTFITDQEEKKKALTVMVNQLEPDPLPVIDEQFTAKSLKRVNIGRIDIDYMSGKKAKEVVISL